MANATVTYTVPDPATQEYTIPFPFLRQNNIYVEVNGSASGVTWEIDGSDLTVLTPTLLIGELVTIRRVTPVTDAAQYVSFADGATLRKDDLETMRKQLLFILQEYDDAATSGMQLDLADTKWDALTRVIKNVGDPTNAQDAATKSWVEAAFATGGVLPTPALATAGWFVRQNALGTSYYLAPSLEDRYLFKVISQVSGPAGYSGGWQLPAYSSGFNNSSTQRAPLELVQQFNDLGYVNLDANTYDLVVGAGQWIIEVTGHLRGLTDTGNVNGTHGQLAITNSSGSVLSTGPEVLTGYSVQVQDSGSSIFKTGQMSATCSIKYWASFGVTTTINLRGLASTSSHSVVADVPTYLSITRVTR